MNINTCKILFCIIIIGVPLIIFGSCTEYNSVGNPHFDKDGYLITDDSLQTTSSLSLEHPNRIKFYVEVSGSMNGFFRANKPTQFKSDVWEIVSYYSAISPEITILTNDGNQGESLGQSEFQTMMNTGAFVSTASTKVPLMLKSIISNLKTEEGEVAVLISDMKYSPVGAAAPDVLMTQYSTDISKLLGSYNKAVSLVCATSDYLDKTGNVVCERSPYYFFIIGDSKHVGEMRNGISTLLEKHEHFVDNIESGFDYGKPKYSFGIPSKCEQLEDEPTFIAFEEPEDGDTCTVRINVNLENYRWILGIEEVFRQSFSAKALYGSEIKVGKVDMMIDNITNKELKRTAVATVELKVFNMATDAEVIEWSLQLPDTNYTLFNEFFEGATSEDDVAKSYSVLDFVKGIFYGGVINKTLEPNYILISKKG